jgi:hypothetical protein
VLRKQKRLLRTIVTPVQESLSEESPRSSPSLPLSQQSTESLHSTPGVCQAPAPMPRSTLPSIREEDPQDGLLPLESPAAERIDASKRSAELTFTPTVATTTSAGERQRPIPSAYLANAPAPPTPTADFAFLDNPYEPQPQPAEPKPVRRKKQPRLSLFPPPQTWGNPASPLKEEHVSSARAAHIGSSMAASKSTTALVSPESSSSQSTEDQKDGLPAPALKKQRSYGFLPRSSKSETAAAPGSKKERRFGLLSRLGLSK